MTDTTVQQLLKSPTGIKGLDDILNGGLPQGRISLVCGGPGSGKTLLASEFLVRGALIYDEPGVLMVFEETAEELSKNVASLGIDLVNLIARNKIYVDYVYIERSEIEETGEYDLEGLFIRLAYAIDSIGAKRVVLDTIETIFAGFTNESILRSELRRLFRWLKDKGVTTIVTGERGENSLTRYGLEEYVSDCVILLENRVVNKIANRILRVVKYRGSRHGTDEYPFLIGNVGIWVQPITSHGLNYAVAEGFISTGITGLDEMLDGKGYQRGSSVLISGTAGTGKTSLAASLVNSSCARGERCLYFAFEEAANQIIRNMRSIGINLEPWVKQGLLDFRATRPSMHGIEMHLLTIQKMVEDFRPQVVIMDPLSDLTSIGSDLEVKSMLVRLIDFLKMNQITTLFTSLTSGSHDEASTEVGVSSLMDTWLLVRNLESNGERNRGLYVLKSRGMAHSTQVREFLMTDRGIELVDVVIGPKGVLTGSSRIAEEARLRENEARRQVEFQRIHQAWEQKRLSLESQISALKAALMAEEAQYQMLLTQEDVQSKLEDENRNKISQARMPNSSEKAGERPKTVTEE